MDNTILEVTRKISEWYENSGEKCEELETLLSWICSGKVIDISENGIMTRSEVATLQLGLELVTGYIQRWKEKEKEEPKLRDPSGVPPKYRYLFSFKEKVLTENEIKSLVIDLQKLKDGLPQ